MKPRRRDLAAALISIPLLRLAYFRPYYSSSQNVDAAFELAFYARHVPIASSSPRNPPTNAAKPVPFDVDGDGVAEALVVPHLLGTAMAADGKAGEGGGGDGGGGGSGADGREDWTVRVLDLRPLHSSSGLWGAQSDGGSVGPFSPQVLFEAVAPLEADAGDAETKPASTDEQPVMVPVKITTGHVRPKGRRNDEEASKQRQQQNDKSSADYDRTRHYFCGSDWHDAANNCGERKHCPGGSSSDCDGGQTCYADTPCDALAASTPSPQTSKEGGEGEEEETELATTPAGTLPAIVTVWSDGTVTMHVVTADVPVGGGSKAKRKKRPAKKKTKKEKDGETKGDSPLELRELWRIRPFDDSSSSPSDADLSSSNPFDDALATPLTRPSKPPVYLQFMELDVVLSPDVPLSSEGGRDVGDAVLLGARYVDPRIGIRGSFHALDALSGNSVWDHFPSGEHGSVHGRRSEEPPVAAVSTAELRTSTARRRSRIPSPRSAGVGGGILRDDVEASESCLETFRRSVLNPHGGALPHSFWDQGFDDARLVVMRFDRGGGGGRRGGSAARAGRRRRRSLTKPDRGKSGGSGGGVLGRVLPSLVSRLPGRRKTQPRDGQVKRLHFGRPNVVLFHSREGVVALSLRNGSPVCHLSLLDNTLYSDIDGDGTVDQVQIVTGPSSNAGARRRGGDESASFVNGLVQRIMSDRQGDGKEDGGKTEAGQAQGRMQHDSHPLCHALALSGLPAREEVFAVPLCHGMGGLSAVAAAMVNGDKGGILPPSSALHAVPPLLVEGSEGSGGDVVFALNNGAVSRYDARGEIVWKTVGGVARASGVGVMETDLPTWSPGGGSPAVLERIDFVPPDGHLTPSLTSGGAARPILLSGEDGMALLSPGTGRVLDKATFPQPSMSRPLVADLSGDGTDDVVAVSTDGLWGYRVAVVVGGGGGSRMVRIAVGLLYVGILLAALRNRFGQSPGTDRRSTDE